jgi:NAD(P)-dependent dehydrogenase (short-subunit alcohol dehydrogenase family)
MNIAEKTILITGSNCGIGRALLHEALKRGAKRVYAGTRGALDVADERVTPIALDVTNAAEIARAADLVGALDVLVNNAGVAVYGGFSNFDLIEQHLAVNLFGALNVTRAFLPQLRRSRGAIVNHLSLAALASVPVMPAYSISKAAALNMTQALRAFLAGQGVSVHGVILGPVDTDMNRGLDIPKATPESVAQGIFDGLQSDEEDIFPDAASRSIADGWRAGVAKALERQFAAFAPESAVQAA